MMRFIRRAFVIALVSLIAVSGMAQASAAQQSGGAHIRFVHVIPGASAVDIYTDGQLTIRDLSYGQTTNYVEVGAGAHHISVMGTGTTSSIWEQDINPSANTSLTLVASSASAAAFSVFQDDLNTLPLGKTRFTAIHAIADAPNVDVLLSDG